MAPTQKKNAFRTARRATREMLGLTKSEFLALQRLDSPRKIRTFLYGLRQNFELKGETCNSVRVVLRERRAHCIEGAIVAACALWIHGEPPLLLDLQSVHDFDHVVALYRRNGFWGALSKTNGAVLRSRDPVYRSLRELSLSWLHEYGNKRNERTLRNYSVPFDLRRVKPEVWVTSEKGAWPLVDYLEDARHYPLVPKRFLRNLSRWDPMERQAGDLKQYRKPAARRKK